MFDSFSPIPALALLQRELLMLSRDRRLFGLLAAMTGTAVFAAVILLVTMHFTHAAMAGFAGSLFRTQFFLLFTAALFVVPGAAAVSMVSERRQDCFPLLYTTLIPPGWIVWSKALALVGLFAVLFIGLLPFSGLIYFFAGVEPAALFQGALVLFSLALGTASIGLLASSHAKSHGRALYLAGVGVVAMLALPFTLRAVLRVPLSELPWLNYARPGTAYTLAASGMAGWEPPLVFAAYQFSVALVALLLARRRVLPAREGWRVRNRKRTPDRAGAARVRSGPLIGDHQNPIAAKDCLVNPYCHGWRPWVLALAGFAAGAFLYMPAMMLGGAGMFAFMLPERYFFFLIIPPMMAVQFLAEREGDAWDSLRSTLLTGRDLVRGKMHAAWRALAPLVGGIIVGRLLMGVGTVLYSPSVALPPIAQLASIAMLLVSIHATMAFALHGAAWRKTAVGAITMAYLSLAIYSLLVSLINLVPMSILPTFLMEWGRPEASSGFYTAFHLGTKFLLIMLMSFLVLRNLAEDLGRKLGPSRE